MQDTDLQDSTPYSSKRELIEAFMRWQVDSLSELDVALLVARVIDEQVNCELVREQIQRLVLDAEQSGVRDVEALLAFLRAQGFAQSNLTGVDLTHSSIAWLLQQHQALPIVVAVLAITLADALGMSAHGVNFPGHFLLSIEDELIDPLALAVVDGRRLQTPAGMPIADALSKASPLTIGFRMLNNLKAYYLKLRNWPAMMLVTEYQRAIASNEPSLLCMVHFERGEYCQFMNDADGALAEYTLCVEANPDDGLADKAKACIEALMADHRGPVH